MGAAAPSVVIMLDKERHMQFTFGVIKKFQAATGKDIDAVTDDTATFDDVSTLLWLTLTVEDKELTQEQSDDLFHVANLDEYKAALSELMNVSTPEAEEDEGDSPKAEPTPQIG